LTFVAGTLGAFSKPKGTIIAGIVIGIFAFIVSAIGSFVDGVAALVFASEVVCISKDGVISGDSAYAAQAQTCALLEPVYDCICTDAATGGGWTCFNYDGHADCGDILTSYGPLLKASSGILAFLTLATFVYTLLACAAACNCCGGSTPVADSSSLDKQQYPVQAQTWVTAPAVQAQPVVLVAVQQQPVQYQQQQTVQYQLEPVQYQQQPVQYQPVQQQT
jgi:hypothetical protein